jgi:uncharacterized membrane protein YcaP (DUF421 family)
MEWLYKSDDPLFITLVTAFLIFISIVILTRLIGLRSFAKFTAYDFAFTVAIGSILSSILTSSTTLIHGVAAIGSLLLLTYIFSILQRKSSLINKLISNKPLLLMDGNEILFENMRKARIEKTQLVSKLREANVVNYNQVYAVVLESTGDISVLHKSSTDEGDNLDENILEGVRRTF